MNIKKIKYGFAVAILVIATAFCGCKDREGEIVPIEDPQLQTAKDAGEDDKNAPETLSGKKDGQEAGRNDIIKVYVCGAVKSPNVYDLPADTRIIDAVNAAGGFCDDAGTEYLNLASKLSDGQKVFIPTVSQIEEALEAGEEPYSATVDITSNIPNVSNSENNGSESPSADGLVDINRADRETLMTLPGIGQSKADKIIDYREKNGAFAAIEDIMLIGGIKEGLFEKVKDKICVR